MATLRVIEIFDSLQGEGFWTGVPMTFVRLAGCNALAAGLGCAAWCDTPGSREPGAGSTMEVMEIVGRLGLPRLCLTGGEPLLQPEGIMELASEAHRAGARVHIETNGTLDPPRVPPGLSGATAGVGRAAFFDWVCVSPKPPAYRVSSGWAGLVDELKLVVDEALDAATAERLAAAHPEAVVSVQPLAAAARAALPDVPALAAPRSLERAIALVMAHPDWRLSLQTHKLLGLR